MKKYYKVFILSFKETMIYRFSWISRYLFGIVPIIVTVMLWRVIFRTGQGNFHGFTEANMIFYIVLSRVLSVIMTPEFHWDVNHEIKKGELSKYLLRPINYLIYWASKFLANVLHNSFLGIFLIGFTILIYNVNLQIRISSVYLLLFILSIMLGTILYFLIYFNVALLTFKFINVASFFYTVDMLIEFLSGVIIPLDFLPDSLFKMLSFTPFPYLLSFPLDIVLERVGTQKMMFGLIVQLIWICILLFFSTINWKKGLELYEGAGA